MKYKTKKIAKSTIIGNVGDSIVLKKLKEELAEEIKQEEKAIKSSLKSKDLHTALVCTAESNTLKFILEGLIPRLEKECSSVQ